MTPICDPQESRTGHMRERGVPARTGMSSAPGHLLSMVLAILLLATSGQVAARGIKPGVERWPIKTSVPAASDLAHANSVRYLDLVKLPDPDPPVGRNDHRYQSARIPPFPNDLNVKEGDIISTTGWLHLVAGEDDGDYHIQLSDSPDSQSNCLIVEVPNPDPALSVMRRSGHTFSGSGTSSRHGCSATAIPPRVDR